VIKEKRHKTIAADVGRYTNNVVEQKIIFREAKSIWKDLKGFLLPKIQE